MKLFEGALTGLARVMCCALCMNLSKQKKSKYVCGKCPSRSKQNRDHRLVSWLLLLLPIPTLHTHTETIGRRSERAEQRNKEHKTIFIY